MIEKCKKRKKGQMGFEGILLTFVAVIVGITLFVVVAQTVGTSTDTVAVANASLSGVSSNSTPQYLLNYRSISGVVMYNTTGNYLIPATNYTITNNVVYNGQEAVKVTFSTPAIENTTGYTWKISGTAEPLGYVGGAGRSIALIIPIFFALLIAVIALQPTLREGMKELMGM